MRKDGNFILILDFGSQYTQLIARRIRKHHVYCEIHPYNMPISEIKQIKPAGIIFSGGPANIYNDESPNIDKEIFELHIPILGICYGMQLISFHMGGEIALTGSKEYGHALMEIVRESTLFNGLLDNEQVWMSHSNTVVVLPQNFHIIGKSKGYIAAIEHQDRPIYAVQFHPEVVHTIHGEKILNNFITNICHIKPEWYMDSFMNSCVEEVKDQVGDKTITLALSGGVDSTVLAMLLYKAIGNKLKCYFVDNGLLRKNEANDIENKYKEFLPAEFIRINAENTFLVRLKGVTDPEVKRKIIGQTFVEVFFKETANLDFLAQGTLYPDVIESVSVKGPSDTIKTHHNRVAEIQELINENKVIEPLKELFKDEVRELGRELGLPEDIINRHPFPGPGLAIRVLGEITKPQLEILREADAIFIETLKKEGVYEKIGQAFCVLIPMQTVGVMGDERTYEQIIALRAVDTIDYMTADWTKLPHEILSKTANRIINEVKGVNRVVYDISSKPPSTIEWE